MSPALLAYQYVVLRCVPRADREEFINVGVVLYCEEAKFLDLEWQLEPARLLALGPDLNVHDIEAGLQSLKSLCNDPTTAEPQGRRFGMLKAPRSTVLQPGPVHGGVTVAPDRQLASLVDRLVRP
jgi:Protein of unknown function (DUF3037)